MVASFATKETEPQNRVFDEKKTESQNTGAETPFGKLREFKGGKSAGHWHYVALHP